MGLGSSEPAISDTPVPTKPGQSSDPTIQRKPAQRPYQSESPCMAPRASTVRVQGFSGQVAE